MGSLMFAAWLKMESSSVCFLLQVQVPSSTLAGFESQAGFWLDLCPSHMGCSPKKGFGWILVPTTWVQVPSTVLAGFESKTREFKSQAEFWLSLRPRQGFGWICIPAT